MSNKLLFDVEKLVWGAAESNKVFPGFAPHGFPMGGSGKAL
jgi:hypothetical protein